MRAVVAVAFVSIAAPLTGCDALKSYANPEVPIWVNHPGNALSIPLRRSLTSEPRPTKEPYERGRIELDPAHRRVFVPCSDGGLYALRVEDATPIWRFQTLGPVQSEPFYDSDDNSLYFGSNDGGLYKVDADTGTLKFRFDTRAEVSRRIVRKGETIYFVSANDTLVAADRATGKMKWTQHRTPAFGMEIAGHAGPALGEESVYFAYSDGNVMAYSLVDGSERWPQVDLSAEAEQATGGEPVKYLDVDTTPIVDREGGAEVVYVAAYQGGVFALESEGGSRIWHNEKVIGANELLLWEEPARPAVDGKGPGQPARKILIASSGLTGLWGLDPKDNGRTLWHRNLPEGGMTAPVPWQGTLLVGTTRYGIFLFSPLDGAVIDGIDTGTGIAMVPAAFARRAFVFTNGGTLLGLEVSTPKP
ncbi:MAG: PQQ-binding-like beta-propeller repeat protein [Polyangiaceae bacterium]|nr:PQQ-binding-like beta-propeller repeat protein [Polyangiaceae bacterium]